MFSIGSVDAFAAVLGPRGGNVQNVVAGQIFIFDVINVNIKGGYDVTTGINCWRLKLELRS